MLAILNNPALGLFARQGETHLPHAQRSFASHFDRALALLVASWNEADFATARIPGAVLFTFRNNYGIVVVTMIGIRETCLFPVASQRGSVSGCKRSGQQENDTPR